METERKNRYNEKISHLDRYNDLLNEWIGECSDSSQIEKWNKKELFAVYHAFQLAMEVIADISSMIVKDSTKIVKDDYNNYQDLKDMKIISEKIYKEIKDLNGIRNRILHDYNGLVDILSIEGILEAMKIIPEFKERVLNWLIKK